MSPWLTYVDFVLVLQNLEPGRTGATGAELRALRGAAQALELRVAHAGDARARPGGVPARALAAERVVVAPRRVRRALVEADLLPRSY